MGMVQCPMDDEYWKSHEQRWFKQGGRFGGSDGGGGFSTGYGGSQTLVEHW